MTEFCTKEAEHRGVATNRWLLSLSEYCLYQKTEAVMKQNAFVMNESIRREFYDEIEAVLPALQYCLAPKKVLVKQGASNLRSSGSASMGSGKADKNPPEELTTSMRRFCMSGWTRTRFRESV